MKNCLRCKKIFIHYKGQKYCSHECKWKFHYEKREKLSRIRKCQTCEEEFEDNSNTNQRKYCGEECIKLFQYKVKYGLSKSESLDLKAKFPNCGICRGSNVNGSELSVDHCHSINKVRGMLCQKCNQALGGFNDCIDTLKNAIKYLEKGESNG